MNHRRSHPDAAALIGAAARQTCTCRNGAGRCAHQALSVRDGDGRLDSLYHGIAYSNAYAILEADALGLPEKMLHALQDGEWRQYLGLCGAGHRHLATGAMWALELRAAPLEHKDDRIPDSEPGRGCITHYIRRTDVGQQMTLDDAL